MAKNKSKGGKSGAAQAKSLVMQPLYRSRVGTCEKTDYKRIGKKALRRLADDGAASAA
jgi:stalled ribosome alternative rescue factor ArfA